jgi:hypothetical protein
MPFKWLVLGAALAALGCGSSYGGGDVNPCPTCPSSYPDLVFELRNSTAAEAYLFAPGEVLPCCRVLSGATRTTGVYGLAIGAVVGVRAEVGGQVVAQVDCVVTRTAATPVRAVVLSGPPYQLTCQDW